MSILRRLRKGLVMPKNKCALCGRRAEKLITHHLSYDLFQGRKVPCQYLITLCRGCHSKFHQRRARTIYRKGYKIKTPPEIVFINGKPVYRKEVEVRKWGRSKTFVEVPEEWLDFWGIKKGDKVVLWEMIFCS